MEEKESEVNAAFPILRSWGYKTLLEGQISKHLVKPQRVLCALVFLIEFLYQSKCFREVSFSGNKPACGIDKHQASQNRDAQQKQEADEWVYLLLLGPSIRRRSCHVRWEESHSCNRTRRFQTLFPVYGKENILHRSEERGIHLLSFNSFIVIVLLTRVVYCRQWVWPWGREIASWPLSFSSKNKKKFFQKDAHLTLPFINANHLDKKKFYFSPDGWSEWMPFRIWMWCPFMNRITISQ